MKNIILALAVCAATLFPMAADAGPPFVRAAHSELHVLCDMKLSKPDPTGRDARDWLGCRNHKTGVIYIAWGGMRHDQFVAIYNLLASGRTDRVVYKFSIIWDGRVDELCKVDSGLISQPHPFCSW